MPRATFSKNQKVQTKGFTLVELLVVMAIIAFLTVGSFAGLTFGLRQARDTQRKQMVDTLNTAFNAYYSDYNQYPSLKTDSWMRSVIVSQPAGVNIHKAENAFSGPTRTGDGLTTQKGTLGIADYLEGTFNWGPIDKTRADGFLAYYFKITSNSTFNQSSFTADSFSVCTVLENKNGGNVARPQGIGLTVPIGTKDCYCLGGDYQQYGCNGMSYIQ